MRKHKKIITVIIILVVAVLMFASFFGIKIKNKATGEEKNLLPKGKLGMEFGTKRVITATVDDTVTETIKDSEGNIVQREEGVEYTEEAGYTIEQTPANDASLLTEKNFKQTKKIIDKRLKDSEIFEYLIELDKSNGTLKIEIPNDENADNIETLIESVSSFRLLDGTTWETVFDQSYLKKADVLVRQGDVETGVFLQLEFNEEGKKKLKELNDVYVTTTETVTNEEGEEEEVTNSKVLWVLLNGQFLGSTELKNIYYNDSIVFTFNVSSNNEEIQEAIKAAQGEAVLLNAGEIPIMYKISTEEIETNIDSNTLFIYFVSIGGVFVIAYIYLVVKFRARGFIAVYFQVGFLGVLLLIIRLTNVVLTIEGIAGIMISMVLEYIFTYIVLNNSDKEGMYKNSNLEFFLNTLPIYVISLVFTLAKRTHISSFGMTLFWGILLIYVYNFVFTKFIFENICRR